MYILEGPEKCVEGWGSLTCTGFTTIPRKAKDVEQVSLHCADAATMKEHSIKSPQLGTIDIGPSQQFTLQWDTAHLIPGGRYHFVWTRNGVEVSKSGILHFRERDEEFLCTTNQNTIEALPIEELQNMFHTSKDVSFARFYKTVRRMAMLFYHFFIHSAIFQFYKNAPLAVKLGSRFFFKSVVWAFKNWRAGRQIICSGCQTPVRPFGFGSSVRCTKYNTLMFARCFVMAMIFFWFARSGLHTPVNMTGDSGRTADVRHLWREIKHAGAELVSLSSDPAGGAPRGADMVQLIAAVVSNASGAALAVIRPVFWVVYCFPAWIIYWFSGLAMPCVASLMLLNLNDQHSKCCKCAVNAKLIKPCSNCARRK